MLASTPSSIIASTTSFATGRASWKPHRHPRPRGLDDGASAAAATTAARQRSRRSRSRAQADRPARSCRAPRARPRTRRARRRTSRRGRRARTRDRRARAAAPIGSPPPSAFASVSTSASTPAWCIASPVAAAAHAGLHLVGDEQRAALVAEPRAPARRYASSSGRTPPSPMTGSSSTAPTSAVIAASSALEIAGRHEPEPVHERLEGRALRGCPVAASVAYRASVERPLERDDRRLPARETVLARELDRGLVGLGAGVAEEDPRVGHGHQRGEPIREPRLRLGRVEVADHVERVELVADGRDPRRMRVSERASRRARPRSRGTRARVVPDAGARRRVRGSAGTARTWASRRARS